MGTNSETHTVNTVTTTKEMFISADSHVMEPVDLWYTRLPLAFRDGSPQFPEQMIREGGFHPGGWNPNERIKEMASDGVTAEVLYPTLGLWLFSIEDMALQQACFQVYNDWLIEYCRVAQERLIGIAMVSLYDVDHAIREMERCKREGLRGAMIWQVPPLNLSFASNHYEHFWAAAQDLEVPISLHILTGYGYSKDMTKNLNTYNGLELCRVSVNLKLLEVMNSLFDIIFSGALRRFPGLRLVLVENEIGWIPFVLEQWDKYFERFRVASLGKINERPSEYFYRQVYATFFNDYTGGNLLSWWKGIENCMWSSDYPHPNSTWPHSRQVIERDLGRLPSESRKKLVFSNVAHLYNLSNSRFAEGV